MIILVIPTAISTDKNFSKWWSFNTQVTKVLEKVQIQPTLAEFLSYKKETMF